jgi:heme oxygenase (mycobilin-producing)
MTVIKINAITVPADTGDELAHRFAARAGAVDDADGFEGFELLKPDGWPGAVAGLDPLAR